MTKHKANIIEIEAEEIFKIRGGTDPIISFEVKTIYNPLPPMNVLI